MKVACLAAALVAVLLIPVTGSALSPPLRGAFPRAVLDAAERGAFAPGPDSGAAAFGPGNARPAGTRAIRATGPSGRALVVPVDFPDDTARYDPSLFQSMLFNRHASGPGTSASDYYWDVSLHQYTLSGDVLPHWLRAKNPRNYYARNATGLGDSVGRSAAGLVYEALRSIDSLTDFSPYDADGDGFVDGIWLLHSGLGAESNPVDGTLLRSHASYLNQFSLPIYRTRTPWPGHPGQFLQINRYICVPEISGQHPGQMSEIGVFCHEYGHVLGLPDLYDLHFPVHAGLGNWDLMASGGYGGDGQHAGTPTQLGAWCRERLGWLRASTITTEGPMRFGPTETEPGAWKLWSDGRPQAEYLLLENRQPIGWDRYLQTGGLLVTHVDEALIDAWIPFNWVQRYPDYGIYVIEADNLNQLFDGINRGDGGDAYPGSRGNPALDETTQPPVRRRDGFNPNISLKGIRQRHDGSVEAYAMVSPQRWGEPRAVPGPVGNIVLGGSGSQSIAVETSGTLHVVWAGDAFSGSHVRYVSKRLGVRWDAQPVQLDSSDIAYAASVAVDSRGSVMVVWEQVIGGKVQVMSRRRPAGGEWDVPRPLRTGVPFASTPTLAVDSKGRFFAAWSEVPDSISPPRVVTLITGPDGSWDPTRYVVPDDSGATNPQLVIDTSDRGHVLYMRQVGALTFVHHSFHPATWAPPSFFWSAPIGPLSPGLQSQTPLAIPLDSARVLVCYRKSGVAGDDLFFRRLTGLAWEGANGPVVEPIRSGAPVVAMNNTSAGALDFIWEDDRVEPPVIRYREVGLGGASDAGSHVLAGPGSTGTTQPFAVWDRANNLNVFWVEDGGLRMRTRQGTRTPPRPPQIIPLAPAGPVYLGANHPNPVISGTRIPFEVKPGMGTRVRLSIHDVTGRRVRSLLDRSLAPGPYESDWDGTGTSGRPAPAGVYFYRLELAGGTIESRKLLLVR